MSKCIPIMSLSPLLISCVALSTLLGASACGPSLYAVTTPPPTREARLQSNVPFFSKKKHFATLSTGVALGVLCTSGAPCRNITTTIDDPTIVKVVPAHLARLQTNHMTYDNQPASTFVLVGLKPGRTMVRVATTNGGTTTIRVDVTE